jgi:hypothetical protein
MGTSDDLVSENGEEKLSEEEIADAQREVRTIVTKTTRFADNSGRMYIVR